MVNSIDELTAMFDDRVRAVEGILSKQQQYIDLLEHIVRLAAKMGYTNDWETMGQLRFELTQLLHTLDQFVEANSDG